MRVSELWIYPIKSCGGIGVTRARVGKTGFDLDRAWMIVKAEKMLTQRENPKLAEVRTSFDDDLVKIDGPGGVLLLDPKRDPTHASFRTEVWDDVVEVVEESKEASQYFSETLGQTVQLVRLAKHRDRKRSKPRVQAAEFKVGFADSAPFLLTNQRSLAALQREIMGTLPMNRFRPNIVIEGKEAYEEDRWKSIQIGAIRFSGIYACDRCVVTTVDQATGVATGPEPLRALSQSRKIDNEVFFGVRLIHENEGEIAVGDRLSLLA